MRPLSIDTVLIATDLTDEELPALRTAMDLSRLAGAQLHVVHACGDGDADLTQQLDAYLRRADPDSVVLPGTTIRAGQADQVIANVAESVEADVIVLGPHRSDRSRSPGSTAYRVAADAERPCLVLPTALQLPLGRILIPVDGSGAARGALAVGLTWGSALRRPTSAHATEPTGIVVMHVEAPASDVSGGGEASEKLMNDALAAAGTRVTAAAGVRIECSTARATDAATAIVERAAQGFDLIILGTRAHGSHADGLGSVAAAVVEHAGCPVLLVPPRVWLHEQDS
ncbi:MAG: universal stress protein [Gemmatimonadetes bacterium]|nr:universal stress protein [Gemmatimonadota bacterium]